MASSSASLSCWAPSVASKLRTLAVVHTLASQALLIWPALSRRRMLAP
jgi:hypothetical protein